LDINPFINQIKNYLEGKINKESVLREIDDLEEKLLDMENQEFDEAEIDGNYISELLEILDNMGIFIEEEDVITSDEFKEELKKLEEIQKSISHEENKKIIPEKYTEASIMEEVLRRISEEDFNTTGYHSIKKSSEKFYKGEINKTGFNDSLEEMLEIIEVAKANYEETYISPDEWTIEVYLGDKMLLEGLQGWGKGLNILKNCSNKDRDNIDKALGIIYEANKKLVINQHLAKYIDEQAGLIDDYHSSGSGYKALSDEEMKVCRLKSPGGGFMPSTAKTATSLPFSGVSSTFSAFHSRAPETEVRKKIEKVEPLPSVIVKSSAPITVPTSSGSPVSEKVYIHILTPSSGCKDLKERLGDKNTSAFGEGVLSSFSNPSGTSERKPDKPKFRDESPSPLPPVLPADTVEAEPYKTRVRHISHFEGSNAVRSFSDTPSSKGYLPAKDTTSATKDSPDIYSGKPGDGNVPAAVSEKVFSPVREILSGNKEIPSPGKPEHPEDCMVKPRRPAGMTGSRPRRPGGIAKSGTDKASSE